MIKGYVILDNSQNIVGFSTFQSGTEVVLDNPIIDISKMGGYEVVYKTDGLRHFVFNEEKCQQYLKEQEYQASVDKANELLNELSTETVLTNASDEDAYTMRYLYPTWTAGIEYKKDNRIMYEDKFFKVLQDHTSQAAWLPTEATSLYVEISDPSEEYPQWKQPTSSVDAYMKGDKVTYEEVKYVSLIDNNVWSPKDYPQGWKEVE